MIPHLPFSYWVNFRRSRNHPLRRQPTGSVVSGSVVLPSDSASLQAGLWHFSAESHPRGHFRLMAMGTQHRVSPARPSSRIPVCGVLYPTLPAISCIVVCLHFCPTTRRELISFATNFGAVYFNVWDAAIRRSGLEASVVFVAVAISSPARYHHVRRHLPYHTQERHQLASS